jgi:hypothetical protein
VDPRLTACKVIVTCPLLCVHINEVNQVLTTVFLIYILGLPQSKHCYVQNFKTGSESMSKNRPYPEDHLYVFGPHGSGSGSISTRYVSGFGSGSGSFYNQTKIVYLETSGGVWPSSPVSPITQSRSLLSRGNLLQSEHMKNQIFTQCCGSGSGIRCPFDPWIRSGSGSGMNDRNHISESLETIFWVEILKFFYADPGWKKFGS